MPRTRFSEAKITCLTHSTFWCHCILWAQPLVLWWFGKECPQWACLCMLSTQLMNCSGRIRYGFVGGGESLGLDFDVSKAHITPSASFSPWLLPEDQDVMVSATSSAPCLPVCCLAPCHDNNELIPWTVSQPPIKWLNASFYELPWLWYSFRAEEQLLRWISLSLLTYNENMHIQRFKFMSTLAAGICPLFPDVSACGACFSRRRSCSCLLSASGSLEPMSLDATAIYPPGRKATVQVFPGKLYSRRRDE